jgi:transcriptional regulator with XRE-family HTH domain
VDAKDPTYIDQYVGRRVRLRRGELDLSQEALAEKLGITFQQLQKYENGRNRVSAGRLYELARTLETTIMYFYSGVETLGSAYARGVSEDGAEFKGQADTEAIDLVIAFREIRDASQRKSILATVKKSAAVFVPSNKTKGKRARRHS